MTDSPAKRIWEHLVNHQVAQTELDLAGFVYRSGLLDAYMLAAGLDPEDETAKEDLLEQFYKESTARRIADHERAIAEEDR